ncbi:MAG: mechanosensitive ion channel domain-containing protein [Nautiliaceae bacterium]
MRFFILVFFFVFVYSKPFDFNKSDFTFVQIDFNIVDEKEYLNKFYKLIYLENLYLHLPKINKELNKKISTLSIDYSKFKSQIEFYRQKLLSNQKIYLYLNKHLPLFEKEAFRALGEVYFDTLKAKEKIKEYTRLLESKKLKLEDLDISLQKNLVDVNKVMIIKKEIEKINNSILDIKKKLIREYLILWLDSLKREDKKVFEISDEIFLLAREFDFYDGLKRLLINLEKLSFGDEIIIYNAKSAAILVKIKDILSYPLFKIGEMVITPLNFGIMIFILIAGLFVGRYYKKTIFSIRKRYNFSHSTAMLLGNLGYYVIFVVAFLVALKAVGLDLSSLTIIAGALSVGIGFGLQNIVSNFVSGIILMFENSIKVGDYIQIDENTKGEVIDISMRSTIIRTNDNIDLIIPNQTFIQNNVINWTLNDEVVRI